MSETGDNHGYAMFVAVVYTFLVPNAAARMDDCSDSCLVCDLDAVREGEEGVRCHNGAFQVEAEAESLGDCLFERVNP